MHFAPFITMKSGSNSASSSSLGQIEHVFNEVRHQATSVMVYYAETGIGVGAAESVDDKQAFTGRVAGSPALSGSLRVSCESGLLSFYRTLSDHQTVSRVVINPCRAHYLSENDR
ncbi:hypothetical protein MJ585_26040 [Klebsiella pneumoniae]|nr:hypothetical protein MJ585_26040 [Klebsiella pneumoniae]